MKRIVFILSVFLSFHVFAAVRMPELKWSVSYSADKQLSQGKEIPAIVPGAVQLDIARAENYPPYVFSDNYKQYGWMEDMYYTYKTQFKKPVLSSSERLYFVSKGIDYQFEIYLNGEKLFYQEGMFTYVNLDLTDKLQPDNSLQILIYPVPKKQKTPVDRSQAAHVVKPAVSYGWDWHPRLVPLGIWDDTYLEKRNVSHIDDVFVKYVLSDKFDKANIELAIEGRNLDDCSFSWTLKNKEGKNVLRRQGKLSEHSLLEGIEFKNPELWWSYDHGTPYLYTSVFELKDKKGKSIQKITEKIGFRRVRLVMNEGAWDEPEDFPKGRSVPPAQLELNGRKIFAKGTNWVNPEIFPGIITRERYNELIDLAVEANFNMFRIWGGGIVNKESFFELCDEKGILVWEEFPLSCNLYPDEPHYLSILKQEATSIVKRLRKHPCLAMWCGGNELFNNWSLMTDQSLPLRLLNSICLEYDPLVPYNPTSPLYGMAHGCYIFKYFDGREVFEAMNNAHNTAYTEFGMPGISPMEVLKQIIPENQLFPPKPNTAWQEHHAFGAWAGDTWLCPDILNEYFGQATSLEELIAQSQLMQSEGYKAIYEEARRQKPYCSMALNWCYNEPWPAAVNNSLLVYPAIAKPAFYAVSNSCRPLCTSARLSKFVWNEGEEFFTEIWLLNDKYEKICPGKLRVKLQAGNETIEILTWDTPTTEKNTNLAGPTARFKLPKWTVDRFKLILEVDGKPEYNSEYTLLYRPKPEPKEKGTAILNMNN